MIKAKRDPLNPLKNLPFCEETREMPRVLDSIKVFDPDGLLSEF